MEHSKLMHYLKRSFSVEDLKDMLGRNLVDQLIEWNSRSLTKALLSEMILCIHGTSILKNKSTRLTILENMPKSQILSFREFLPGSLKASEDLATICETVANRSWRENEINNHFLELLSYDPKQVFEKRNADVQSVETVEANEKFYELLDYQYIIRQQALNILESDVALCRFLIHMPTGTGKTKTATHIACHYLNFDLKKHGLILWIAHTKELLQQAYDTFTTVWKNIGDGEIFEYKLWDKFEPKVPEEGFNGIMVCGIQKLQAIKSTNPVLFARIHEDARLVVFDEAHKASAEETRNIINELMSRPNGMKDRSLMGLTATSGRTAGHSDDNVLLSSMFGSRRLGIDASLMNAVNFSHQEAINAYVEENIIRYFQERGVLSKIKREELEYPKQLSDKDLDVIRIVASGNGYDDYSSKSLELIGKNKSRNMTIKNKLIELNEQGVTTIVFACSVAHAQLLSAMLTLDGASNAVVYGGMSAQERSVAISRFKNRDDNLNILINYEVLTTGFDATNIDCVFIARPTKSIVLYSQMIGRGLRGPKMGGNDTCLLIDVKDNLARFDGESTYEYFSMYWNF